MGVILLPLFIGLGWYITYRVGNSRAISRLEAKARQRGEPLTLAALAATYPPIPDEENAAIPILELWEQEEPAYWKAFRNGQRPPSPAITNSQAEPARGPGRRTELFGLCKDDGIAVGGKSPLTPALAPRRGEGVASARLVCSRAPDRVGVAWLATSFPATRTRTATGPSGQHVQRVSLAPPRGEGRGEG